MFFHKHEDKTFLGVALAVILVGAAIFAFGIVSWLINISTATTVITLPSLKVIGGLIVMALGYVILELDLIRKK